MGRTEEDFSFTRLAAQDGYVVVEQDESGVHQYVGLFKGQPLGPDNVVCNSERETITLKFLLTPTSS